MDLDELRDEMLRHAPDPETVRSRMNTKRRGRRRRRFLLAGTAACVAAAVVGAAVAWPVDYGPAGDVRAAPATASSPPVNASSQLDAASGCASMTLARLISLVRTDGASLILAHGTLTGRRGNDPSELAEMVLDHVETLAGPVIAERSAGWVSTDVGPTGHPLPSTSTGSLWAPDGALIGVYWPQAPHASRLGPYLHLAPVVDQQVILSSAGCWFIDGVETRPFKGPLAEVPGSDSYNRSAPSGFRTLPLDTVRRAAAAR